MSSPDPDFNRKIRVNDSFFSHRASAWGLSADDAMVETCRDTLAGDSLVIHYVQEYKGITVGHAQFAIHARNDTVYLAHGFIEEDMDYDTLGIYTESEALTVALDSLEELEDSIVYAWNDPNWEDSLKVDVDDTSATFYPDGNLRFINTKDKWASPSENIELLYEFLIVTSYPRMNLLATVDAFDGTLKSFGFAGNACSGVTLGRSKRRTHPH